MTVRWLSWDEGRPILQHKLYALIINYIILITIAIITVTIINLFSLHVAGVDSCSKNYDSRREKTVGRIHSVYEFNKFEGST